MILPESRSTHTTDSSVPFGFADVIQISRPKMTGDDQPRPGIPVLLFTLFVSLHVTGKSFASETPCPLGPRNCGQSARELAAKNKTITPMKNFMRMKGLWRISRTFYSPEFTIHFAANRKPNLNR